MFGHNEVAGRKFFRESPEARAGMLLVTSVFRTLQGEGPYAGVPAIFVRLAKCQLQCEFCDTYFDSGDWLSRDELLDRIAEVRDPGARQDLLVVTGGEPTLQEGLGGFLRYSMAGAFAHTQVESNGLLEADLPRATTLVVSPKCARGRSEYLRPPAPVLARADCLKFVVSGDPASPYAAVPEWALAWRRETRRDVYVSPMAEYNHLPEQTRVLYDARRAPDMAAREAAEKISFWEPGLLDLVRCRRNYEYAALYAVEHGLRLTIQMHLFASLP